MCDGKAKRRNKRRKVWLRHYFELRNKNVQGIFLNVKNVEKRIFCAIKSDKLGLGLLLGLVVAYRADSRPIDRYIN